MEVTTRVFVLISRAKPKSQSLTAPLALQRDGKGWGWGGGGVGIIHEKWEGKLPLRLPILHADTSTTQHRRPLPYTCHAHVGLCPTHLIRMFCGFMSRWMMRLECR